MPRAQATASDDRTWRMWHLPDGGLVMSGEGHKDWVAALDFHPRGICLASGSGDATVRVWDFQRQACVATLVAHTAAVWSVAFHDASDILASGSLDHSIRLWDVAAGTCKQVRTSCFHARGSMQRALATMSAPAWPRSSVQARCDYKCCLHACRPCAGTSTR
jgi:WD40 repeat protein